MTTDFSKLKRTRQQMPPFVRAALEDAAVMGDFEKRPAYQQNDYLAWIKNAKRQDTRIKRLLQMLNELEQGGIYMKMKHPASAKKDAE